MEPNVVFVYKIETDKYLSLSELREVGEWQTYEINHPEEFSTFNHEESKPLEGRGYSIGHDDNTSMLDIINKQIQKHRIFDTTIPVHIAISESTAGCIRYGLKRPKVVIGFPDFFSYGPVWRLDEKIGQTFRFEWLYEHINTEQEDYEFENKFTNTLLELEDIPEGVPIYLWTANNAGEQTGFRLILQLLKGKGNEVFLLNTSDLSQQTFNIQDAEQIYTHTSQIEPKKLRLLYEENKAAKPLTNEDRLKYQVEWIELSGTKEVLRLWVNNEIVNFPEHHFDQLIINTMEKLHNEQENKDFIKTARVIGAILAEIGWYDK